VGTVQLQEKSYTIHSDNRTNVGLAVVSFVVLAPRASSAIGISAGLALAVPEDAAVLTPLVV
jgi:hypothetical protein